MLNFKNIFGSKGAAPSGGEPASPPKETASPPKNPDNAARLARDTRRRREREAAEQGKPKPATPAHKAAVKIAPHIHVPPGIVKVLSQRAVELATAEELEVIRQADTRYARAHEFLMLHIQKNIRMAKAEEERGLVNAVLDPEIDAESALAAAEASDAFTKTDWREDFAEKRRLMKVELRKICSELQPLIVKIARRLGPVARKAAIEELAEEQGRCARWGLTHQKSYLVALLEYIAEHPERLAPNAVLRPRTCLAFAGITITT